MNRLRIYPNPASTEIYIDLTGNSNQIDSIKLISLSGQELIYNRKTENVIDISTLSDGMYIIQIELVDGGNINQRVLILR